MDATNGTVCTDTQAAPTPKLGGVKPSHIFAGERRKIDKVTLTDLVKALKRDGCFLHPIAVRAEGAAGYRLIAGHHRLAAWKHCFGDQPIPANIYPSDAPDELINALEIEENLLRKELTAKERQAEMLRYAAALKKLDGEKLATELPVSGSDAGSATRGGRGKKAATAKVAGKLGLSKAAVQKQVKAASAAIGEEIDLDRDTVEELERKAEKRRHAEPKVEPRKPILIVLPRPTSPAKPEATEADSKFEVARKAFDALDSADKPQLVYYACLQIGLDPLKMAPPAAFGLLDEEAELAVDQPDEVAPAIDHVAVDAQAEQQDDAAQDALATDDAAQGSLTTDDGAVHPQAEQQDDAADLGFEDLQDAGEDVSEAADQEPAGPTKCAYCNIKFEIGDQLEEFNGQLFHGFCVEDGKRLAKAKQGKPIAIAA